MTAEKLLTAARVEYVTACAVFVCLAGSPPRAHAETTFNPYATVNYEHNANVFSAAKDDPLFANGASRGDNLMHYVAGAKASLAWGLDTLGLSAEGARYDYSHNDQLTHTEARFGGKLDWHLGPVVSGDLLYTQARTMTSPADTLSQDLEIQTERLASGIVKVLLTPRWRLDLQPSWHSYDLPLPQYPEFGYDEKTGAAAVNYLGIARLTAGLRGEYVDGSYHHIVGATEYTQKTAELTASYAVTGFSSFDMRLGYTWRNSSLVNPADANDPNFNNQAGLVGSTQALTGSLGFTRRLSVKTAVNLKAFREVGSYVAGANPQISTGGEAGVTWRPDVRTAFSLRYRISKQTIEGQQIAVADIFDRQDRTHDLEGSFDYLAARWLTVRPYAQYHRRTSNLREANYDATIYGIGFTARLHPEG